MMEAMTRAHQLAEWYTKVVFVPKVPRLAQLHFDAAKCATRKRGCMGWDGFLQLTQTLLVVGSIGACSFWMFHS